MKYMLLIHQGTTPIPGTDAWENLSQEEKGAVYASYQEVNQTTGLTPGQQLAGPERATTVRVQNGSAQTSDGAIDDPLGGYAFFEADDVDAAVAVAAKIPAARMGGAVEVRPLVG
jgi:hypothetical protein